MPFQFSVVCICLSVYRGIPYGSVQFLFTCPTPHFLWQVDGWFEHLWRGPCMMRSKLNIFWTRPGLGSLNDGDQHSGQGWGQRIPLVKRARTRALYEHSMNRHTDRQTQLKTLPSRNFIPQLHLMICIKYWKHSQNKLSRGLVFQVDISDTDYMSAEREILIVIIGFKQYASQITTAITMYSSKFENNRILPIILPGSSFSSLSVSCWYSIELFHNYTKLAMLAIKAHREEQKSFSKTSSGDWTTVLL